MKGVKKHKAHIDENCKRSFVGWWGEYSSGLASILNMRDYIQRMPKRIRSHYGLDGIARELQKRVPKAAERKKEAIKALDALSALPMVHTIEMMAPCIVLIKTNAIYADIRKGDGEKETERKCIGLFNIFIDFRHLFKTEDFCDFEKAIEVRQVLFERPNNLDHWAIHSERMCMGDWLRDFSKTIDEGQLPNILILILNFLQDTNDGSAYTGSHTWIRSVQDASVDRKIEMHEIDELPDFADRQEVLLIWNGSPQPKVKPKQEESQNHTYRNLSNSWVISDDATLISNTNGGIQPVSYEEAQRARDELDDAMQHANNED